MTKKRLDQCPTIIKECLDWLVKLKEDSGAERCQKVIKEKLFIGAINGADPEVQNVCTKADEFLKEIKNNDSSYKSAYSGYRTTWQYLCSSNSGSATPCCKSTGGTACSNCPSSSGGTCDGCCSNCPKQICARIFCLIVPVLFNVFDYLNEECKHAWSTQKIQSDGDSNDLKNFLTACGFDTSNLNDIEGSKLVANGVGKLTAAVEALRTIKVKLYEALKGDATKENTFLQPKDSNNTLTDCNVEPRSISDMLQWLMFLPYSSKYNAVLARVKENASGFDDSKISPILHCIPLLFLSIEGTKSSFFSKIALLSKCHHVFDYAKGEEDTAKTLLAIIPILHSVFGYLDKKCKTNGAPGVQEDESWNDHTLQGGNNGKNALKNFLTFMGFDKDSMSKDGVKDLQGKDLYDRFFENDAKKNGNKLCEKLQILHNIIKDEYFKTQSSNTYSGTPPSTIRQMMLWLIGLPLTSQYGNKADNGLENEIKKRVEEIRAGNTSLSSISEADVYNKLSDSIVGLLTVFAQIEGHVGSVLQFLKEGFNVDGTRLKYEFKNEAETASQAALSLSASCAYAIHCQLRFLMEMCNRNKEHGGWMDCYYGGTVSTSSNVTTLKCGCRNTPYSSGCPNLLQKFLLDTNGKHGNKFKLITGGSEQYVMGFTQARLTLLSNQKGSEIYPVLSPLLDHLPTPTPSLQTYTATKPFTILTQYLVAISQREPGNLADCMELFQQLKHDNGPWTRKRNAGKSNEFKGIEEEFKKELKNVERGDKYPSEIKSLLDALLLHESTTSDSSQHFSISSLLDSNCKISPSSTCAPYIQSLSRGLYLYYVPNISHNDTNNGQYDVTQWLYDKLRQLYDEMKMLHDAFNNCQCCQKGINNSPCSNLIDCPEAHTILYKFGLTFGAPGELKARTCEKLRRQLNTVLKVGKGGEPTTGSTLFKLFMKVIEVVFLILKLTVENKVNTVVPLWYSRGRVQIKTQVQTMKTAFTNYSKRSLYDSHAKLLCTFACRVFDKEHECAVQCQKFKAPGQEPDWNTSDLSSLNISATDGISITAVTPEYIKPVIDSLSYHTYKRGNPEKQHVSKGGSNGVFTFRDAIDFHLKETQCILPAPMSFRSIIDWLLRITEGKLTEPNGAFNTNANIKGLTERVRTIIEGSKLQKPNDSLVCENVSSLVKGIRVLMGYKDDSEKVKKDVKDELDKKVELHERYIKTIEAFIQNRAKYGDELAKALLKGQYEIKVGMNENHKQDFKTIITKFHGYLNSTHPTEQCVELHCYSLKNANSSSLPTKGNGLNLLKHFFMELGRFTHSAYEIGDGENGSSSNVVSKKRQSAEMTVSTHVLNVKSQADNTLYKKLVFGLMTLGGCHSFVEKLIDTKDVTSPSVYRKRIQDLIGQLHKFLDTMKYGTDEPKQDIPLDKVVDANNNVMSRTKRTVESFIKLQIKEDLEAAYASLTCRQRSQPLQHLHSSYSNVLCVQSLIAEVERTIESNIRTFKSHIDDLRQLCQWLYRMGQLYNCGLKQLMESLVVHLKHIKQVICWIEAIDKMIKKLKDIGDAQKTEWDVDGFDSEELKKCCDRHNTLYSSNKYADYESFCTALNCRINNLLSSYVLQLLPVGEDGMDQDKIDVEKRTKLLRNLKLVAQDRFTLQLWRDEAEENDSCIRDWILFEDGIVKNSDIQTIKEALSALTAIDKPRIYDFHAVALVQKFSFEEAIRQLEFSLERLKQIENKLEGVRSTAKRLNAKSSSKEQSVIAPFCSLVYKFCGEPYGIYNFSRFLHIIAGPNLFSSVIRALEAWKDQKSLDSDSQAQQMIAILNTLCDGLPSDIDNKVKYKLDSIIRNIESFITVIRKEYKFSYPSLSTVPRPLTDVAVTIRSPSNKELCPSYNKHRTMGELLKCSNSCPNVLAKVFIGCIPNLVRHFTVLNELCQNGDSLWHQERLLYANNGTVQEKRHYLSFAGYMSRNGWNVKGIYNDIDTRKLIELNDSKKGDDISACLSHLISLDASAKKPLNELFNVAMDHFKSRRETIRQSKIMQLQTNIKNTYGKEHDHRITSYRPHVPTTVRETLFWLHEIDQQRSFYKTLCEHIEALCGQASIGISCNAILHVLKLSITQSLEVLSSIENPGGQNPTYLYDLYCEEHYYDYGADTTMPVFFHIFMEKLMAAFLQLNFLCVQCEFPALEGGWSECHLRKPNNRVEDAEYSLGGSQECLCARKQVVSSPESTVQWSSLTYYTPEACSRPLYSLLYGDSELNIPMNPDDDTAYPTPGMMKCGFKLPTRDRNEGPQPTVTGGSLVAPLKHLVGGHADGRWEGNTNSSLYTVIYLRDLLRYFLCLAVRPPWSTGENIAFIYRLSICWGKILGGAVPLNDPSLLTSLQTEIKLLPGTFNPAFLTDAVEHFAGLSEKWTNGGHSGTDSHSSDLKSLVGCKPPSSRNYNCSPYMLPLAFDVYTHFDHQHARAYLSWILHFGSAIYRALKELKEDLEGHFQASNNRPASTLTCSSPSIVQCSHALTEFYRLGLTFGDYKKLNDVTWDNSKQKENAEYTMVTAQNATTCRNLVTQLGAVLQTCDTPNPSPLHRLIEVIEQFLWSIREPFAYSQFGFWSIAVLFLLYVFVVPMDHFKIKSHYFNQVRFTMHPSLLLSHGARKVTDVSYFKM